MPHNNFLDQIKTKKDSLKPQTTLVTTVNGSKYKERMKDSGELEIIELNEASFGFVLDEKPDLQLAEILPFLFLSSQDVVQEPSLLITNNITHVLSVGTEIPKSIHLPDVIYKKIDLLDVPEADLLSVCKKCFEFIDNARTSNESNKILVHCNAGYSRSPSVVIAYIMKTYESCFEKAFNMVKKKRNISPNKGFINQLKQFETQLMQEKCKSNLKNSQLK